jgi:serine-type D-Ala-D-Ala carboxypeptidase/endopeptidase (penicillin-binding protein 4)
MGFRWYWLAFLCLMGYLLGAQEKAGDPQAIKDQFRAELDKLVQLPGLEGASISWSFRATNSGQEVEARNSTLMLIPASTVKLYTSIAALDVLGPAYRYRTKMYLHGEIHRGRLFGDVVVVGSGDPSLGHRNQKVCTTFLNALNSAGIERIRGRVEADPFGLPYTYALIPRDRAWEDVANYYGGGVYGLNWRNNSLSMRFLFSGDSVKMEAREPFEHAGAMINLVKQGEDEEIFFFPEPFSSEIHVTGKLSRTEAFADERMALPKPPLQFIRELHDSLYKSKLSIREGYAVRKNAFLPTPGDTLLAEYLSPPMEELLKEVNRNSNNLYAEAIARTTGMQLGSGGAAEEACSTIRRHLIGKGLTHDTLFLLREGSGLGRKNLVSTYGMTDLLSRATEHSWFPIFESSLATPGQPGTLKSFKPIQGLKAKTGSLSGIRAYAGYFTDASGNRIAFSIIINHYLDGSGIRRQVERLLESASQYKF